MTSTDPMFSVLADGALASQICRVVEGNVRRPQPSVFELSHRARRRAVPAISTAHFTREDEGRIARAFAEAGQRVVYAIALEPLKSMPAVIQVAPTKEGLREFQRTCSHFNYVLSTSDCQAMVVCTTDEYLVYVGELSFVEQCAGTTETAAARFFAEYADSPAWPGRVRRALVSVHKVLAEEFPAAREGEFVRFPK